ncbi:coenzyme F420-reducing hydrogenase, beta subunit [Methanobrevibacter gottschalkii]|uniref:Coenzyme F420 hydrogenase subunit beta n=2 Tax=Methanobrevibacter gottschalkii TaxID=190974 RepID=A0A3N5B4X9_9EURY|nr:MULTISPECIES: coenzyme F420 hydrogenase subunit beta [Methanobrevibacter]OEC93950.1 coenzyme F420 hydrogenase subunit beta [Methanobrevibacter sp. A27]RPF52716.1 coenzyme F420-reducing hydrogenase beta subunit [Methanobrevibacter gottschalkii DSM 11977]SEK25817.1 coenzyme F420-reducing hydrogenase, beta subunit [Methanobrevibacter gottschalkii]
MPLGNYKEAISARATEKKILDVSQDGGIVSALLCYALDEGKIEGAVVAGTPDDDWRPVPTVVTSSDEVIANAGTKYSMSPTLAVLKEATRQYGLEKIGVVATPCQIQGLRKAQAYPFTRFVVNKINLIIGIYCMENFPMASLDTFATAKLGFDKLTDATKMDIGKGKFWLTKDGEDSGLKLKETHGYEQSGCNICTDYVAEWADISTGSVGSPDGWSTVLTRTDDGNSIFKEAVSAGLIETKPVDDGKFGLPLLEKLAKGKKDKNGAEFERRAKMGVRVPTIY